jgi:hypothetical protein
MHCVGYIHNEEVSDINITNIAFKTLVSANINTSWLALVG